MAKALNSNEFPEPEEPSLQQPFYVLQSPDTWITVSLQNFSEFSLSFSVHFLSKSQRDSKKQVIGYAM